MNEDINYVDEVKETKETKEEKISDFLVTSKLIDL